MSAFSFVARDAARNERRLESSRAMSPKDKRARPRADERAGGGTTAAWRDDRQRIVARIAALYTSGYTFRGIAEILDGEGIRAPQGGVWKPGSVAFVVDRYAPGGLVRHKPRPRRGEAASVRMRWEADGVAEPATVSLPPWIRIDGPAREIPIEALPISAQLERVLRAHGVETLGDLDGQQSAGVIGVPGFGAATVSEFCRLLWRATHGRFVWGPPTSSGRSD